LNYKANTKQKNVTNTKFQTIRESCQTEFALQSSYKEHKTTFHQMYNLNNTSNA